MKPSISKSFLALVILALLLPLAGCRRADDVQAGDGAADGGEVEMVLTRKDELRDRIDEVLRATLANRQLGVPRNGAWQVLHGVLAYGRPFEIVLEQENRRVPALDWAMDGGQLDGWTMRRGSVGVKAVLEQGTKRGQGHEDQWLAIIAQCDLPSDHPIQVAGEALTVGDLLKQSMHDVYEGKECSWTLIGLSHYLPKDATWLASDGKTWSLEKIIGMEAAEDIDASACGGSHRLIGMQMALDKFQRNHPDAELEGGWQAAREKLDWAIAKARENQLPSGAFSINYFARAGNSSNLADHLGATGHTLEFLSLALEDKELEAEWVVRATNYLCELFEVTAENDLECGALYHAVHGLVLYRARRWGAWQPPTVAAAETVTTNESPTN